MSRRFRPTDAFVDESLRGQRSLMVCVLVEARHLTQIRRATASLVGEGKRLHFHQELDSMRRTALELIATMPVRVTVVVCGRRHGVSEFQARDACLAEIVRQLQDRSVPRLTVESRQDDSDDHRTILRTRRPEPSLTFDHRQGQSEPILWVADAVVLAFGAGNRWMPLVEHTVERVVELRPYSAEPGSPTKGLATGSTSRGGLPEARSVCARLTSDGKSDVVWIRLPRKRVMSARRRCHASALLRVWHPRSSSHVVRHDGDWRGHWHGQRPSFSSERQPDRVLSHLDVWLHRASWHHRPSTAHGNLRPQRRRDQFRARELTGMCAGNGGQRTD